MSALRNIQPTHHERRKDVRLPLAVKGRLMLDTRQELDCQITDMSLSGMHLKARAEVSLQATVVAYVDHFGRLQGKVVRKTATGFAVALAVPEPKRERLANMLTWLANRGPLGMPEDRCHERLVPNNPETTLELVNREVLPARLSDFSRSGAAVLVDRLPEIDARVVIGRTTGRVVRHFEGGIGVEFLRLIPSYLFDENYAL